MTTLLLSLRAKRSNLVVTNCIRSPGANPSNRATLRPPLRLRLRAVRRGSAERARGVQPRLSAPYRQLPAACRLRQRRGRALRLADLALSRSAPTAGGGALGAVG